MHQYRVPMLSLVAVIALGACDAPASGLTQAATSRSLHYQIDYIVTPQPARGGMTVELRLRQPRRLLREFGMHLAAIDSSSIEADGELTKTGDRLVWLPPENGGVLRWFAPIDHMRFEGAYDAYMHSTWALFRGEDIIPPARTRTLKGATSKTRLTFKLPQGWSSTTQYFGRNDHYRINIATRRFDQPTGWMLLGDIGVRNDDIEGTRVIVAGPVGHSVRRLDILALLQWTLPELRRAFPDFPDRLTIISAADPMWRGGLSAPASLFVHAGLPLISENGTSTLLHEVLHIGLGLRADNHADWIVEGLAEFYGLELLRRSGTISRRRHTAAIASLREWGGTVKNLCQAQSTGAITARAAVIFLELNNELKQIKDESVNYSLDDLVLQLIGNDSRVTVRDLQDAAIRLTGSLPTAINTNNLPGCTK